MRKRITLFILAFTLMQAGTVRAQCTFLNTAFDGGEYLAYNLYYNWKFVWVKAGTASFSIVSTTHKGQPAYRGSLVTRGSDRADEYFVMRDTLLAYCSKQLVPLYYRKGAREGKRYYVDEVFYSYADGETILNQHALTSKGEHKRYRQTSDKCVYDMLNMFLRARSFNPSGWNKGHRLEFPLADGDNIDTACLRYNGKTTIKADNGKRYRCLELSYLEYEKNKWKEIVRFYVTDDQNHIPIRLDMFLRFGSAKAFLTGMKGAKNPIAAEVTE